MSTSQPTPVRGRFAPSPSGRMHLGNLCCALLAWLSVRSQNGEMLLRIEDLDPQRSKPEYTRLIEDDLCWLGLEWDEGGTDGRGPRGPYLQSLRHDIYADALRRLEEKGLTYRCICRRADILATQAPHESDGRVIYKGTCRPPRLGGTVEIPADRPAATRLFVPDRTIKFTDRICGPQSFDLATHCGDFILRRADGAWAYQLAAVVDDALMGVTEVVRGNDLLLSTAQQIYLYSLLGYPVPEFAHLPLLCNAAGQRLSKRDGAMAMDALRAIHTPQSLLGHIAHLAGLLPAPTPIDLPDLISAALASSHPLFC